ncbi:hypothetical protein CR983_03200 [Candidatus Saccharibacteria bacterium]|nr:MAG: hypothetical protein CR983_03200 [Candidatus Saccharibacteria bacterium]
MKYLQALGAAIERRPRLFVIVLIAVFSALVFSTMTQWSIWFDEAFGAYLMRFDLVDIIYYTALDVHPPLYYWLLKGWTSLFGISELTIRLLSWLCAVIAIVGLYVLIRRLFDSARWAVLAVAVAVLSPILVRFSYEGRMYTMVLAIVVWATYVLWRATQSRGRLWWTAYGLLLAAGMLTHYFAAFAWLAHWAWRWWRYTSGEIKMFWTREWVWSHALAVSLFAVWIPIVVRQFASLQAGFWIPPLSAYTPVDYLSNMLLYRQYGEVTGWWAIIGAAAMAALLYGAAYLYRHIDRKRRSAMMLLMCLAVVPPLLLLLVSVPPLSSTFIDRYVLYAQLALAIAAVLGLALLWRSRRRLALLAGAVLLLSAGLGIGNVYYYGNYNKNSSTSVRVREIMQQIEPDGTPVIVGGIWTYYEAAFYERPQRPVYFLDTPSEYRIGSAAMLRDNEDRKIRSIDEFARRYRYIWWMDHYPDGDIPLPRPTWQRERSIEVYDPIDDNVKYRASLFDTRPEQ